MSYFIVTESVGLAVFFYQLSTLPKQQLLLWMVLVTFLSPCSNCFRSKTFQYVIF